MERKWQPPLYLAFVLKLFRDNENEKDDKKQKKNKKEKKKINKYKKKKNRKGKKKNNTKDQVVTLVEW